MSTRTHLRFRIFKLQRWVIRGIAMILRRALGRIERRADFDPLVWAASDAGELRMFVSRCEPKWEIHIKVNSNDGMDTYESYTIDEVAVVVSGHNMRDAIDAICLQHCQKHRILP